MSIQYYPNIPQPGDNPSQSQDLMLQNFSGINSWTNIDHIQFQDSPAGTHKQVTLPVNATITAPTGLSSVISTVPGTANPSISQLIYNLPSLTIPLSVIRAFAVFPGNGSGAVTPSNSYNVASINTNSGSWTSTITLSSGATTGTQYLVLSSSSFGVAGEDQIIVNYNVLSATQFTLRTVNAALNAIRPVNSISFVVLQF